MTKNLIFFLILLSAKILSGQNYTISGYVEDAETGEKLISAYVIDIASGKGTVTNSYGFYSLTLPKDSVLLKYSYLGYKSKIDTFYLTQNINKNILLIPANILNEVTIEEERVEKIEEQSQMSKIDIPLTQVKALPALFGETDVLKAMQLLPGVQSGTEGTSGLYVRGGSPDQNLVLLDNVPVYNVSHVLGIFSVFNADALKNVNIIKGGFPARYGGRLSSVLDIHMKEGNIKTYHGSGNIGNLTSKLMLEGPIIKDKASFIVSGRRSYVDLILKPLINMSIKDNENVNLDLKLYFYDLNVKANVILNEKNRLYLSLYSGKDIFGFNTTYTDSDNESTEGFGINWGNIISAARWNYEINSKLFLNTTFTYSKFTTTFYGLSQIKEKNIIQNIFAKYYSGIEDYGFKADFDYIPNPSHYIKYGASAVSHTYYPGAFSFIIKDKSYNLDTILGYDNLHSREYDLYFEDDFTFGNFKANAGIHASGFATGNKFYKSVQPRISLRYLLPRDIAVKASFVTMKQYINLITSESISTPFDLWLPSTEKIKPQRSWQGALGLAKTLNKSLDISIEGYYKEMTNVISYLPGESFFNQSFGEIDWQNKITQGKGQSYGLEFFLQKKKGKLSGWIAYTLSWNWRQFDAINNGEKYPFKYDRRHDFAIVTTYKMSKKITFSASWIYATGNAVTISVFKYKNALSSDRYSNISVIETLGEKNAFRVSDTHRLDISFQFHKKRKLWQRTWVIGIYNAYFHNNPFYVYTSYDYKKDRKVFKEVGLLPFLPFISYQFKF